MRLRWSGKLVVAASVLAALLVTACSSSKAPESSPAPSSSAPSSAPAPKTPARTELKVRVWDDILDMAPGLLNGSVETAIAYNVYSGLITFKPGTTELVPDLAEKWSTSPDGLTYTFNLRKGVKWHKGFGELTSKDVKYSFDWILDKNNASPFRGDLANVASIETPDDYTVIIKMKQAQPSFPSAVLAYRPGMIVKKEALEKYGKQYNGNVIGTGPYIFDQWIPKDRIVLKANPDYWGPKPKLQTITFLVIKEEATFEAAILKGDVDLGYTEDGTVGGRLAKNKQVNTQVIPSPRTWFLQFNLNKKPFDDPRVRQAVWLSLNKQEIVDGVFQGAAKATDTLLNTWTFGRMDEMVYKQDIAKAKDLLNQAGLSGGLKTVLHTYPTNAAPEMATVLKEQMSKIGIDAEIKIVEWADLTNIRKAGNFSISMQPQLRTEPDQYFTPILHSSGIPYPNSGGYKGMDALIDKARAEVDAAKRKDLYLQIQKQMTVDAPVIPLVHPSFFLVSRPEVKGAIPANLTYNLSGITVGE